MIKARQIIRSGGKPYVVIRVTDSAIMAAPATHSAPVSRCDFWIPRLKLTIHCVPCKIYGGRVIDRVTQSEFDDIRALVSAERRTRASEVASGER